jgi:hypothetical protein
MRLLPSGVPGSRSRGGGRAVLASGLWPRQRAPHARTGRLRFGLLSAAFRLGRGSVASPYDGRGRRLTGGGSQQLLTTRQPSVEVTRSRSAAALVGHVCQNLPKISHETLTAERDEIARQVPG